MDFIIILMIIATLGVVTGAVVSCFIVLSLKRNNRLINAQILGEGRLLSFFQDKNLASGGNVPGISSEQFTQLKNELVTKFDVLVDSMPENVSISEVPYKDIHESDIMKYNCPYVNGVCMQHNCIHARKDIAGWLVCPQMKIRVIKNEKR